MNRGIALTDMTFPAVLSLAVNSDNFEPMIDHEAHFEILIQQLLDQGYGTVENFLSENQVTLLRNDLENLLASGKMKSAGIGQQSTFQNNREIRSDLIYWIEPEAANETEKEFLGLIQSLMLYLNHTCYTGLNAFEFHYAVYGVGSFYKKHIDQFKSDSGRKYSVVIYLNEHWKDEDGGQLILYNEGKEIRINPEAGRIVFFESDKIEHEVLPATRQRMSVTGWLKRT